MDGVCRRSGRQWEAESQRRAVAGQRAELSRGDRRLQKLIASDEKGAKVVYKVKQRTPTRDREAACRS
jgi:hypothetical protein